MFGSLAKVFAELLIFPNFQSSEYKYDKHRTFKKIGKTSAVSFYEN